MSEHTAQNPETPQRESRKTGCLTCFAVIAIIFGVIVLVLGVLVWFNVLRPGEPLRISKETTYITEPLTPDGRFVDYFAALKQEFHPPEMQTDENGYRVVFRALGDFSDKTEDFAVLQKRYEALGLDATHDKPTMSYVEPEDYFNNRYTSHPEEFEDIIAAEKEKYLREQEEYYREQIEEIKADPDWSDEEKNERIAEIENDIAAMAMSPEERESMREEVMRKRMDEANSNESLTEHEKQDELFSIQLSAIGNEYSFDPMDTWQSLTGSMKLHENAIMRQWLEENNVALDLVTEQVKKPVFVTPYFRASDDEFLIAILLPDAPALRSLVRGLSVRAQIRLGDGDIDGAIDDMIACYQLGRHIEKKAMLVEGLVGLAIEGIGDHLSYDIGSDKRANTQQLERLRDAIASLTPQKGFLHKMKAERYMCLDSLLDMVRGGSLTDLGNSGNENASLDRAVGIIGLDWNITFQKVNRMYDELIAGTFVYTELKMNPIRLLTTKARSETLADIFIDLLVPVVAAANEAYRRAECAMNMRRIVLSMHLYEREHGTLPPTFTVDENGKPLHGWRTLLLPYFGDETLNTLYSQIRLDEPWDSEHNRQFHQQNIDVYRCPSAGSANQSDGETNYSVIVGDELLFTSDGKGQPLDKCGPIMLLITERKDGVKPAVCWMCPDAEITQAEAETGVNVEFTSSSGDWNARAAVPIGGNHTGGCNFGLRDGGVTFISEVIDEHKFRDLVRGTAKERP